MANIWFYADGGAVYVLTFAPDGVVHTHGLGTRVTYSSDQTDIVATGKVRDFGGRIGTGQRAVLHLDTGEGIEQLRGVQVKKEF